APLFLTAMVSIDPSTVGNGCLEIAPGRHKEGLLGEEWRPLEADGLALAPVQTDPGDVIFFDSFVPHASAPNRTAAPRRILYVTYSRASDGDHRARYFADKRRDFPPDIEREPARVYTFRVCRDTSARGGGGTRTAVAQADPCSRASRDGLYRRH